jgi:hypothetical protein
VFFYDQELIGYHRGSADFSQRAISALRSGAGGVAGLHLHDDAGDIERQSGGPAPDFAESIDDVKCISDGTSTCQVITIRCDA